jgi:hypothetical protein
MSVFVHKADNTLTHEHENEVKQLVQPKVENTAVPENRPEIIQLDDIDQLSDSNCEEDIKFHRSPRKMDDLELLEHLDRIEKNHPEENPDPQSITKILNNIPKDYFRHEKRYESIDAVLNHISAKRKDFMLSINSDEEHKDLSKTIEPIINSICQKAHESRAKFSTLELHDKEEIQSQSNSKHPSAKHTTFENPKSNPISGRNKSLKSAKSSQKSEKVPLKNEKSGDAGTKNITFQNSKHIEKADVDISADPNFVTKESKVEIAKEIINYTTAEHHPEFDPKPQPQVKKFIF